VSILPRKHSAANFLKKHGMIDNSINHPDFPHRPSSDLEILKSIGVAPQQLLQECI